MLQAATVNALCTPGFAGCLVHDGAAALIEGAQKVASDLGIDINVVSRALCTDGFAGVLVDNADALLEGAHKVRTELGLGSDALCKALATGGFAGVLVENADVDRNAELPPPDGVL